MSRRGMALITVLLAASLLAMLATSLVIASRGNLISGEQYRRRLVLLQCCYSGLDYAKARLLQEPGWARIPFSFSFNDANLSVSESGLQVTGSLKDSSATFELQVVNNLKGITRLDPPPFSRTQVKIPPHCALVSVLGRFEGNQKRLEVLLTRGTLLTNSVSAGGDVAANVTGSSGVNSMEFRSNVPRGNTLRARNDIYLPDTSQVTFAGTRGLVQSGGSTTVNSTVQVFSDGTFRSGSGSNTRLLNGDPSAIADASTRTGAQYRLNSSNDVNFSPDKLVTPSGGTISVPPGDYTFTAPDQVSYTSPAGVTTALGSRIPGVEFKDFRFIPQGNVEVQGNLKIKGTVSRQNWVPNPSEPGGGHMAGAAPTSTSVSLGLGYEASGIPKSALDAKDRLTVVGNLTVEGDLVGNGQIFVNKSSGQGGVLDVVGNSMLSSTRTDGLAVVTQGLARFREIGATTGVDDMPALMVADDINYYKRAIPLEANASALSADVFDDFHRSQTADRKTMAGASDQFGQPGLRNQDIGVGNRFTLASSPGGLPLNSIMVSVTNPGYNPTNPASSPTLNLSAKSAIDNYVRGQTQPPMGQARNLTLGEYLRIREFVKSIDMGRFNTSLIDTADNQYSAQDETIRAAILNQIQAFDQDARNSGQTLMNYVASASTSTYSGTLKELIFGGILYSEGNVVTFINNKFNLFGAIMARGNVGFGNLVAGKFVFDPSLVEDQFEISKLGLVPVFFWSD
ncbi:hypothetical protein JST97_14065 [bacterium]|nr:hypothetical protein [bacterium]